MNQFNLGWIPLIQQELRKFFASKGQGDKADTALQPGAIGTTVQGYDADLQAIAALNTDGVVARTGAGTAAIRPTGATGLAVLASADAPTARTAIAAAPLASPTFTGTVTASATTASTSTTTGALVVTGGLGVGGRLYAGPWIQAVGTESNSVTLDAETGNDALVRIKADRNNDSGVYFGDQDDSNSGSILYNHAADSLAINVNAANRMLISSTGNVGIGTVSPATRLHVDGTIRYTNRPAAATITAIGFDANGDLRASSSSLRYKHDIQDLETGLEDVMQLRPVQFKFNGETRTNMGFIAEEVAELGLEDVMLRNEENQPEGVIYANMVSLLTKAIQEQQAQIEELKSEINLLKGV